MKAISRLPFCWLRVRVAPMIRPRDQLVQTPVCASKSDGGPSVVQPKIDSIEEEETCLHASNNSWVAGSGRYCTEKEESKTATTAAELAQPGQSNA